MATLGNIFCLTTFEELRTIFRGKFSFDRTTDAGAKRVCRRRGK
jgi:hypothetical protein